jgi:hypothetical protein
MNQQAVVFDNALGKLTAALELARAELAESIATQETISRWVSRLMDRGGEFRLCGTGSVRVSRKNLAVNDKDYDTRAGGHANPRVHGCSRHQSRLHPKRSPVPSQDAAAYGATS